MKRTTTGCCATCGRPRRGDAPVGGGYPIDCDECGGEGGSPSPDDYAIADRLLPRVKVMMERATTEAAEFPESGCTNYCEHDAYLPCPVRCNACLKAIETGVMVQGYPYCSRECAAADETVEMPALPMAELVKEVA